MRAGTATQSEVLGIGRNLYASSQAYNDLFAQVMQIGDHTQHGGGGGSRSGGAGGHVGLSQEDQAKLDDLNKRKAALESANTANSFNTLAHQVAEIASAKGLDFQQVLKDMGINMKDLEKGLGLKSDKELADYIAAYQKQMDSAGANTTSIVAAISALPQQIANAIAGKPINANVVPGPGTNIPTPVGAATDPGTSNPGPVRVGGRGSAQPGNDRAFTSTDDAMLSRAIANAIGAYLQPNQSRGNRPVPIYVR